MNLWEILIIAVSVSLDALAVSVSGGLVSGKKRQWRNAFNAALFFGGFQFLMPLIGFAGAVFLREPLRAVDHWAAFVLLGLVGGKMVWEGIRGEESGNCVKEAPSSSDFFAPLALLVPAVATSLDALAVGAGICFAGDPVLVPALAMGAATGIISACGVFCGAHLGGLARERTMQIIGGTAIVLIGVKILLSDLLEL